MNKGTEIALRYRTNPSLKNGQTLIDQFHNMACKIIHDRWGFGNSFDDLLQEAYLAIFDAAVERYDPELGTEFSTFVYHRITAAVNDEACRTAGIAPIPWSAVKRYRAALRDAKGDFDLAMELAHESGMSQASFIKVHNSLNPVSTSELPPEVDISDTVASEDYVNSVLTHLPPKERSLFSMFYGLDDGQARTANELAQLTGRPAQDIRNELSRSRRTLRKIV